MTEICEDFMDFAPIDQTCELSEIQKIKKEYNKEYNSRPEVKERVIEYYSRPEIKEHVRQYQKQYRSKPEVKEHRKQYYLRKKQEGKA